MGILNKKVIILLGFIILCFMTATVTFAEEVAEETSSSTVKEKLSARDAAAAVQLVKATQNHLKKGEYARAWNQLSKVAQEEEPLEIYVKKMREDPAIAKAIYDSELGDYEVITKKRILIPVTSSANFRWFYVVKQNGKWKLAPMNIYNGRVRKNLNLLVTAIRDYYRDNKKLPKDLTQLVRPVAYITEIPTDPFSDEEKLYVYKNDDGNFVLYSLGPNSKDDGGKEYFAIKGLMSEGDIVVKGKIAKKNK